MAYSYVRYTGNGSTTNYTFSFPTISTDHIKVRVNGTLVTNWSFLSASTIQFAAAPANAAIIEIRRETPKDSSIVNFTDGSVLLERDLDLLATYDLYLAQETEDDLEDTIRVDSLGRLDAQNRRIINVADPVAAQDAVTKNWLETTYTSELDAISLAAASSATAAAGSATTATTQATNATASAVSAANSAAAAATALDNFDDRYLGQKASDPAVDNDGNALITGALYYNTTDSAMRVYTGTGWINASSAQVATMKTYVYVATAAQTTFTGNDANGSSLTYVAPYLIVSLNGLELRPVVDYTATSGLSVVLTTAATAGDELQVQAFSAFNVANIESANVTYSQGGTGSVDRSVDVKLKEFVSVKDFGAVGDGVTDDTAAILAADAAAPGSVLFPAGTFRCTAAIAKRLGISWIGEGAIQGAQSPQQAKTKIVFDGPTSGNAITIDGLTAGVGEANLKITGIHFQATGASQDLVTGIYVGVKVCQIDGNSFTNFSTGVKHNQVETWITNNYFSSCQICIDSAGGESHIVDNHGFPQGGAGTMAILVRGSATNIRGNKFFGDGGGSQYGCVVWGFGNVIVGNTFDAFTDVGIRLISNTSGLTTDNNIVVGNNVSGTGNGGTYNCGILIDTLAANASGNIVVGNSIFNKRGDRSMTNGVRINATAGYSSNNNVVAGNSIANCTGASITQTGSGTRTGNQIYDNGGHLTEVSGTVAGYNGLAVNHGLASTPSVVIAIPESNVIFGMGVDSLNSTTFRLLMRDNTGNLVSSGSPVNVRWYARV